MRLATVDTVLFSYLAMVLMSPLVTECATGIESSLLTGLEIGTLNCVSHLAGTIGSIVILIGYYFTESSHNGNSCKPS